MPTPLDTLFAGEPREWLTALPPFQREPLEQLVSDGKGFDGLAQAWLTASAANTFHLGAAPLVLPKESFLAHVRREVRAYLCGDPKYETERAGLFGENAVTRTFVVSSIAVTIAPSLGVAAPVLSPIVALVLASFGKITLNAWCKATKDTAEPAAS